LNSFTYVLLLTFPTLLQKFNDPSPTNSRAIAYAKKTGRSTFYLELVRVRVSLYYF